MIFFVISLVAGFLTVLTPCVLPILPIVLGSSVVNGVETGKKRAYVVIGSLVVSVFVFTFLLRVSTALIMVPPAFWTYLSGAIIFVFGLSLILPNFWSRLSSSLFVKSNELLNAGFQKRDRWWGDLALGASLGPIFTTCSPTFFVILATVLPASLTQGVAYLVAYCAGLAIALLLIAFLGQKILLKFSAVSDPKSNFKKVLGWIFIVLAVLVATGVIKKIETKILDAGFFDFTKIERNISNFLDSSFESQDEAEKEAGSTNQNQGNVENKNNTTANKSSTKDDILFRYKEIVNPSGFVNSSEFQLADLIGKKVILLDFMTYSCINCQRTFPYLNAWYKEYKDQGLEIVGIHTPEFAFEKNIDNVRKAALQFELLFPLVLDNDYATWNAYANRFWPRKYLIDIQGNVVYDHVGEGAYKETEEKIMELLKERAELLGTHVSETRTSVPDYQIYARSPEIYFGAWRNSNFGNGKPQVTGEQIFVMPSFFESNKFYLDKTWNIAYEYAENISAPASLKFKFDAKEVYIVASGDDEENQKEIEVYLDGSMVSLNNSGEDANMGKVKIREARLYHLISLPTAGEHTLEIIFKNPRTKIYTFTFG